MVEETEEETEEEEGLEYATDTPSGGSYTTPPSTGGHSSPSSAPSRSPTLGGSDPENNTALHTEELEVHIEAFLEEAKEDLMMDNCHRMLFLLFCSSIFDPTSLHILYLTFLLHAYLLYVYPLMPLMLSCS